MKKHNGLNIGRAPEYRQLPHTRLDVKIALEELRKAPRPISIEELKRILSLIGVKK